MRVLVACGGTIFKQQIERRMRKQSLALAAQLLSADLSDLAVDTMHCDQDRSPTYMMAVQSLPTSFQAQRSGTYDAIILEGCQVYGTWRDNEEGNVLLAQHESKATRNRETIMKLPNGLKIADKLIPSKYLYNTNPRGFVKTRIPVCPSSENFLTDAVIATLCNILRPDGYLIFYAHQVHDPEIGNADPDGPVIKRLDVSGLLHYDYLKDAISDAASKELRGVDCLQQITPWTYRKIVTRKV